MGWRTTLRTNAKQKVQDYADANPTLLLAVYRSRPASFTTVPCAYIGAIRMQHLHTSGVRQTTAEVDVVLISSVVDNIEAEQDQDTVADALVEDFTDDPHVFGSNTIGEPVRSETLDVDVGDVSYHGTVITIGRVAIQEGRV